MENLTEVITAAEYHPQDCHIFVYSSSKGTIRLCDMREAALCDAHAKRESILCLKPQLLVFALKTVGCFYKIPRRIVKPTVKCEVVVASTARASIEAVESKILCLIKSSVETA